LAQASVVWSGLVSCRSPTQITVVVTTDFPCTDLHGVDFAVGALGDALETRPPSSASTSCTDGRAGSVVVVPTGDDAEEVAFRIVAGFVTEDADHCLRDPSVPGCIVARRALHYIPHTSLTVPVLLSKACSGIPCDLTATCVEGACVPATIPDSKACEGSGCPERTLWPDAGPVDAGSSDATLDGVAGRFCQPGAHAFCEDFEGYDGALTQPWSTVDAAQLVGDAGVGHSTALVVGTVSYDPNWSSVALGGWSFDAGSVTCVADVLLEPLASASQDQFFLLDVELTRQAGNPYFAGTGYGAITTGFGTNLVEDDYQGISANYGATIAPNNDLYLTGTWVPVRLAIRYGTADAGMTGLWVGDAGGVFPNGRASDNPTGILVRPGVSLGNATTTPFLTHFDDIACDPTFTPPP
jgi:hypothetical protein